ncbi:cystatin-1 [Esox lucius]|uniref:Cystatin domain-containing protein n=1 Tax=Esox lucius TaxID=8010 RepID=A0A3P8YAW7_ESOLU|nr:cystatin-1 [Esox lucius]
MGPQVLSLLSAISALYLVAQGQEQPTEGEFITARYIQPLGGWFMRDPKSPEIQEAVKSAVEHFNSQSKARKYFRLVNVLSAETQVTNMINHKITAIIGKTKCLKSDNTTDVESCVMGKKRLTCTFEVQFNPRNEREAFTSSCQKSQ